MALMTGLYTLAKLALIAAVVGAVDWLLIGLFEYNFIADIFGSGSQSVTSTGERIIYIAFGVGGIIALPLLAAGAQRVVPARSDRRVVTAPTDRDVARNDEGAEERDLADYAEFRHYQAWKAEKGRHADQADVEAAQAKQDEQPIA
jgi:uncharacterized membrane protein YuzA (DUF378 family)